MTITPAQAKSVAKALKAGAYVLSDNDGTLAPFTRGPDETVIPTKTMAGIAKLQEIFGPDRFTIVTGRDLGSMRGVLERSSAGASRTIPILSDDGAVYAFGAKALNNTTADEQKFMTTAQGEIKDFVAAQVKAEPGVFGLAIMEFKGNGINVNTNAVYARHGAETEQRVKDAFFAVFDALCKKSPQHDGAPGYALHAPAGHGLEIRSTRTTKQQGIENLVALGILPAGKAFVLLVDDIKAGGNDVAAAQMVKKLGGIVVQVRHEDPARAYPDVERAIEPDIALASPAEVPGFLRSVLREYAALTKTPPAKNPGGASRPGR